MTLSQSLSLWSQSLSLPQTALRGPESPRSSGDSSQGVSECHGGLRDPLPCLGGSVYVTPEQLAKQMAYRDLTDVRLTLVCQSATDLINNWIGVAADLTPVPATVEAVALSLAVDLWKQPDATFGIMGLSETGPVRVARDLVMRYDSLLIPYYDKLNGWGIA